MPQSDPYAEFGGAVKQDPYAEFGGSVSRPSAPQTGTTPSPGRGGRPQGPIKPAPEHAPTFANTLASGVASIPGAAAQMSRALLNTGQVGDQAREEIISGMGAAQHNQFEKGREAFKQGDYVTAAGRTLAGAIPVLGPAAAEIGDNLGDGNYGQAAANALLLGGGEMWNRLGPKKVSIPRTVENVNNPVVEKAVAQVAPNVRMTPGQRSGQTGLQTAERNLKNMPGTATKAEQFYQGQQDDIAAEGQRLVARQGGQVTNPYGAGQATQQSLKNYIQQQKEGADQLYDSVRKSTAANVRPVQTGVSPPSPVLGPNGKPYGGSPVFGLIETPVDLAPIRQQLQPIYDDLAANLTPVKQSSSPAFTALKNLMDRTDLQQMPAMEFDKFLGALKSITRNGQSGELSTQSQRLATQVISAGEKQLDTALAGAGPKVAEQLKRARESVKAYHDTDDFLTDIQRKPNEPYEPSSIYYNLVHGGDRVTNTLKEIQKNVIHPDQTIATIGRTYLQEMMDKATREGGWGRSAGVSADWQKLGPGTKSILYGPSIQELDNFFLAAKKLTPAVGSPTADRFAALVSYGDVGTAIAEFVAGAATGHPVVGAMGAASTLAATRVRPAILAKLSFKPAGAKLLTQALTLPINSPAFNRTMTLLNSMAVDGDSAARTSPPASDNIATRIGKKIAANQTDQPQ